ncbi:alkylation response protein AidB-like acyl-CoA dehydrogenase [Pseudomonas laurylsulfatiphila]|uniref:acyl-CoA dehydrogenase n=1 Tax=Pseudomonas laurylsulfatiphila TaxID=2011015 RepID=UPI003D197EC1
MNPYVAPLEEMRFVLRELADIERVTELCDSEALADPELMDAILDQAALFAQAVLAPLDAVGDRERARWSERGVSTAPGFTSAYKQFVEAGWNNISIPPEHGGQGLPALLCAALHEVLTSSNKAFCYCANLTEFAVKVLVAGASESLKSLYIPKLVSGQWTATLNLTEQQAGSDLSATRTCAEPMADGTYKLFGEKKFISYGEHDLAENIVHLVLARVSGSVEGTKDISLFLVPKYLPEKDGRLGQRNDIKCISLEQKLGNHANPTCTMAYGDSGTGAIGWLIGTENNGLQPLYVMTHSARFQVGQEGTSLSERAYQQALAYSRERVQGKLADGGKHSVPIIRHPDVRRMLLMMRSQTEAMRAVAYSLASARDLAARHPDPRVRDERQAFVNLMIPIFKGWASETAIDVTSTSIQVHGGLGYLEESSVSQPLRDVRAAAILEGTTSIQAHDLVECKLVRDGGAAMRAWLAQAHITLHQLSNNHGSVLRAIELNLRPALEAQQEATDWALANYHERPLEVLAGSVPLLRLCGIVVGGWQMARAALAAERDLELGHGHAAFLRRKLVSAHFYATHVLPQAGSLASVAMQGGESTMTMGDAAF